MADPVADAITVIRAELQRLIKRNAELESGFALRSLQERIEALEMRNTELTRALTDMDFPGTIPLTRSHRAILGVLVKRSVATQETVQAVVGGVLGREVSPTTIKTQIYKMRRNLAPLGIEIKTQGGAFYLDAATRQRLKAAAPAQRV